MAGLLGSEQMPRLLQRLVGAQAERLVEQQQPVQRAEHSAGFLAHLAIVCRSFRATKSSAQQKGGETAAFSWPVVRDGRNRGSVRRALTGRALTGRVLAGRIVAQQVVDTLSPVD